MSEPWVAADTRVGSQEEDGLVVYGKEEPDDPSRFVALHQVQASRWGLRRAFELRAHLEPEWAAMPLSLDEPSHPRALYVRHPGGAPLEQLRWGRPRDLRVGLRCGLGIARALAALHGKQLVHAGLSPQSVFMDPSAGRAWLTAFWLTSRPSALREPVGAPTLRETLPYIAPEQTGRVSRSVDARSDLYSLGVMLYELLTGALPLEGTDTLDWIHSHVARPPTPFSSDAGVPSTVQALVMRLLSKNPEQRYQTASGVARDLERCISALEAEGAIAPFELARNDTPTELVFSERLYGRDAQVRALEDAFSRVVASGGAELVLVTGSAGVGKSSLVHQLRRALPSRRGHWASGKLDLLKRDTPYASLARALEQRLRVALGSSDAELQELRGRLQRGLGPHGGLLARLLPELPNLMGSMASPPELPPEATKRRLQSLLVDLVATLAGAEQPMVLFLDDLQWLDAATLEVLELLSVSPKLHGVLLLGAYRREEVPPEHPLRACISRVKAAGGLVQELQLEPLADGDLTQLLTDTLQSGVEGAAPLADLLRERTAGNPFFVRQFLGALVERALLRYEPDRRCWSYSLDAISAHGFTDNVLELMLERLSRLPEATRGTLSLLACLGDRTTEEQLVIASGESAEALKAQLSRAVEWGALRETDGEFSFSHDGVREAAYALLGARERFIKHLELGRRLAHHLEGGAGAGRRVFTVVDQLARAAHLLHSPTEREATARLALAAGKLARESAAPAAALGYFEVGLRLLAPDTWRDSYDLSFALSLGQAECALATGDVEGTFALLDELLPRARGRLDLAAARRLYVVSHVMRSEYGLAVGWALEALAPFGVEMSARPTPADVDAAYAEVQALLVNVNVESLAELPLTADPDVSTPMSVLAELFAPACFTDEGLAFLHLCRMVRLSLERGLTEASAHAFAWFGVMLGHVFGQHVEGARFVNAARRLVERRQLVAYDAKTLFSTEIVRLWTEPLSQAIEAIRAAFRSALETGDLPVACFACHHVVSDRLVRGDALDDVLREAETGLSFVRRAGYRDVVDELVTHQRYVEAMRGKTHAVHSFTGDDFDASQFEATLTSERMPTMVFWYWVLKAQAEFMGERFEDAWRTLERARSLRWSSPVHIQYASYHLFRLLTITALDGQELEGSSSEARLEQARAHRDQLALWAEINPATFRDKLLLADAELSRVEARDGEAAHLYEEAASVARERGFVHQEALAHELAARFLDSRGFTTPATGCWLAARAAYARWGAHGKLRQLEARRLLMPAVDPAEPSGLRAAGLDDLDFENVVKALQSVSREIVLDRLVETIMRASLQTAGADRGVLVLTQAGEPSWMTEAVLQDGRLAIASTDGLEGAAPVSLVRYVLRVKEAFVIADTAASDRLPDDAYFQQRRPQSVACLPLVSQGRVGGALYLENGLTRHALTPRRLRELSLLASQAAISLENARLYRDLSRENAERLRVERLLAGEKQLLEMVATGADRTATLEALCRLLEEVLTDVTCAILVLDAKTGLLRLGAAPSWPERAPEAGDLYAGTDLYGPHASVVEERAPLVVRDLNEEPRWPTFRERVRRAGFRACWSWPINSNERVLGTLTLYAATPCSPEPDQARVVEQLMHVASIAIERSRVETTLHQLRSELAHVGRVATLGELTASIAHEVNQPLAGIVMNGRASLRWLDRQPPELTEARQATLRLLRDATRASDTIGRLRDLFRKGHVTKATLDLEDLIGEVLLIAQHEVNRHGATVVASVSSDATRVLGNRVQLQQVLINLILNALEAMSHVEHRPRELRISVASLTDELVQLSVADSGVGAGLDGIARLFEPFVTSKPDGMGIGLSISRSIVEDHGGKIWAEQGEPFGMVFRFTLPRVR